MTGKQEGPYKGEETKAEEDKVWQYPSQCARAHTHTRSSRQPFMLWCPGSSWGFGALLKGLTSVVVLKVERALYIHSPHLQFLQDRDSNSPPLDYESNSLTIRPRLPRYYSTHASFLSITLLIKKYIFEPWCKGNQLFFSTVMCIQIKLSQ